MKPFKSDDIQQNTTSGEYLRPLKSENLKLFYDKYENRSGRIGYKIYDNLEIKPIGSVGEGFIVEKPNWILDDCNSVAEKRIVDKEVCKSETVVYAGFMRHQWGHFIVNTMSRLWFILKHPEVKYDKIVFSLLPGEKDELNGNFLEFFKWLGILDKIEFIDKATPYRKVIVPELSWSLQHHYSEEFNLVFDCLIDNIMSASHDNQTEYPQKVFFTRSRLAKAQLAEIGMGFLDSFFEANGYTVIAPESLNLEQMVKLMQNADIVAGAAGSTVHNILFGKRGQKLIICERNVIVNDFQPGINLARNVEAIYIDTFLTVNSVNSGLGPFFYYPTEQLLQFAGDNSMILPNNTYFSPKWLRKNLRQYFRTWQKFYHRQWYFQKCQLPEIDAFHEAYSESCRLTGDYLRGYKELFWYDWLSPAHVIKKYLSKSLVNKLRRLI